MVVFSFFFVCLCISIVYYLLIYIYIYILMQAGVRFHSVEDAAFFFMFSLYILPFYFFLFI